MTSRRRFVAGSGLSVAALAALGRTHLARAAAAGDVDTLRVLARVARVVFPHDALSDDVYAGIAGELLLDGDLEVVLRRGVANLGGFLTLDEAGQATQLQALDEGLFLEALIDPLRAALYTHSAVWELIGYPGPSFPEGYVDKGFDDIDWLPAS